MGSFDTAFKTLSFELSVGNHVYVKVLYLVSRLTLDHLETISGWQCFKDTVVHLGWGRNEKNTHERTLLHTLIPLNVFFYLFQSTTERVISSLINGPNEPMSAQKQLLNQGC